MTKKVESLHFTLGENAGKMLMEVAQETLIYSLNPEKALSTIKDTLIGCPEQLALEVLVGQKVIIVNDDQVSVSVVEEVLAIQTIRHSIQLNGLTKERKDYLKMLASLQTSCLM